VSTVSWSFENPPSANATRRAKASNKRYWLPVQLQLNRRAPKIRWLRCRSSDFREPFFHESVQRLVACDVAEKESSLKQAFSVVDSIDKKEAACFILHISRCGSTALANALRAAGALVYSEPQPLAELLFLLRAFRDAPRLRQASVAMRYITSCFTRLRKDEPVFIKMPSWSCLLAPELRRLFPETPILFVYRNPAEVMVSIVERATGWVAFQHQPQRLRRLVGGQSGKFANASLVEFCARMIDAFCASVTCLRESSVFSLDHAHLNCSAVDHALRVVGFHCDSGACTRISASLRTYSRARCPNVVYQNDSKAKRERASAEVADWADFVLRNHFRDVSTLNHL
jgi:hypothetical protein